ncbi:DUF1385 domain-containing protein [Candidatus Woesearchaeota archaeon]|nr:DUF1385 domain-containing protein [Candidatus Woesearchaeota archaeon]
MPKDHLVGGQAVIEGVMMKNDNNIAIAVRNENGKIVTKKEKLKKRKFSKTVFVRGIANLVEMLIIGLKALVWSANQMEKEEERLSKKEIFFTLFFSIAFVVLFFIALPYFLTIIAGIKEEASPILFNLVDGIIKVALFVLYVILISFLKDVRRLFQYHGAEHKVVYCYEASKKLTVENAKKFSTRHPRCGTSFVILVFIVSILIFSILPPVVIWLYPNFTALNFWVQKGILFPLRLLFIIPIASITYELLRLSGKHKDNFMVKIISQPGLLLQGITTKEPNKKQIEVAIKALKDVLSMRE